MITYKVNRAELRYVEKKLGDMKSKAPRVLKNAVNKTARQTRKRIAQSARGAYSAKEVGFNNHMKIREATAGDLTASIDADGKPLTVIRFKYRAGKPYKGGAAASTDVVNGGLKQLISSKGGKAFKRNGLIMQRKGSGRFPLKVIHSNSVPKMVEKIYGGERGMKGDLREPVYSDLRKNIEAEIRKIVG